MSNSTHQFTFVRLLTNGQVAPMAAAMELPIGVLQNSPGQGEQAVVCLLGISKLRVGGTDIAGTSHAFVASDANGRAALAVATSGSATYAAARIIQTDADDNDGALVTAAVNCITLQNMRAF